MPTEPDGESPDLGRLYRQARVRVAELVADPDHGRQRVPACPQWSVHDVVAHLVAVVEDVQAGRLTRPPDSAYTAEQVGRRKNMAMADMISEWAEMAPPFEQLVGKVPIWPAFLDLLAHEHDIRGALDRPGGRDSEEIQVAGSFLLNSLQPPVPVAIESGGKRFAAGPEGTPTVTLRTDPFEAFRFRLGRRSRLQLSRMDWEGDPTPVLPHLTIFGPADEDVVE